MASDEGMACCSVGLSVKNLTNVEFYALNSDCGAWYYVLGV